MLSWPPSSTLLPYTTLFRSLQRDHQLITYLLENAPGLELSSFEDRLLLWDYKAMQLWYRITRIAAPEQAQQALWEMGSVLARSEEHTSELQSLRHLVCRLLL